MKLSSRNSLDRLLRAAAQAPARSIPELPWSVENQVLRAWRQPVAGMDSAFLIPLLRKGFAMAAALSCAAVIYSLTQSGVSTGDPYAFPNATINLASMR